MKMGWDEWGKHVLAELKRLNDAIEKLEYLTHKEHKKIAQSIATLNVKSALWGSAAGIAVSLGIPLVSHWLLK